MSELRDGFFYHPDSVAPLAQMQRLLVGEHNPAYDNLFSTTYKQGDNLEWDDLSSAKKYTPLSFWRFAQENGYEGKMPFTVSERRKLLALDFLQNVRLLRDQSDVAYAELKPREWVRIDTSDFRNTCALGMLRAHGKMPQEQDVKSAQMIAQAEASEAAPEHVDLRFARVGGKRYACQLVGHQADGLAQFAHFFCEVHQRNPPIKLR